MCVHRSVLIHVQDFGDMQTHQHHAAGDMALFLEGRGVSPKSGLRKHKRDFWKGQKKMVINPRPVLLITW